MDDSASACEVTILMPCLNEARTLEGCVREALDALSRAGVRGEVLVADNGSTDGSRELAARCGARVVPVAERGYGSALRAGIAAANGRYIVMGDADGSYDFGHLDRFLEPLRAGADLVMGNRFRGGIHPGAMPWKNRYIGNPALSLLGRILFGGGVGDFHCGLRGFRADAIRALDLRTTGMEFASEMVIKARLRGLRVREVATVLRKDGRDRPPHLRPWRDGWRHLRFMLLFSPRWLFLYPGMLLAAAGAGLGARLLAGPLHLGGVTLDIHTLLFCSVALLVGMQATAFALLTKVFAQRQGLLPRDPRIESLLRWVNLESGMVAGAAAAAAGLGLSVWAVWFWGTRGFGDLDPSVVMRWVIAGGTLVTLGLQAVLVSLFLGVLGLAVRPEGVR